MAMILDAFMSKFNELLVQMVQDEVGLLLGVPGEIEKLQQTVGYIQCVIADAEKRRAESMTIDRWLKELKDVMYDADDIMDLCQIKAELRNCSNPPSSSKIGCSFLHLHSCFRNPLFACEIGTKIKEINSKLEGIAKRKAGLGLNALPTVYGPPPIRKVDSVISRESDQLVVMEDIVGEKIEEDAGLLVSWLTEEESGGRGNIVVAIVGMGGLGKTTLAKRIFNDPRVQDEFELKIWAFVSKNVKAVKLLKCIIEQAGGEPGAAQNRAVLVPKLEEAVKGKKFFLILDDVWPESVVVWTELLRAPMSSAADGSRLLVTTRDERVVNAIRATKSHHVERMSDEDGWSLLIKQVLENEEESEIRKFKDIGLKLVEKCDGLPLAIKNIGGVLRMKNKTIEEWQAILKSDAWSFNSQLSGIHQAFYLSYEDLPSPLKQCFIFFSAFPEDSSIFKTTLIHLWFAEGFLQGNENPWELGEEYYKELLARNLLEDAPGFYDNRFCKMHDLLWSFACHLGEDENYILTEENVLNRQGRVAKLRRLSIQNEVNIEVVVKEKGLRTLFIGADIPEKALAHICKTLPNLRTLIMRSCNISILPKSLSSLVHLRHLDVSGTMVRTIPESIGCLRNLLYFDFSNCTELRNFPHSITNLEKLMVLSFLDLEVEEIPIGLKNLTKLKMFHGFKPSKNNSEMFSRLDELETLSHLVELGLACLERVIDLNTAKKAKLWCKNQLKILVLVYTKLSWEDQVSQTNEKKVTIEGVLNELCAPSSLEYLAIRGYFGGCLPKWLNLGATLPNLRWLEIKDCNCLLKLASLGQLPNLKWLRFQGLYSILSVREEFLWGDTKNRDMIAVSCRVIPAFPKLQELEFQGMPNWEEWQWSKREPGMPLLKKLYIIDCPLLRSLPEGLVHHATSLEFLQINGADHLTTVENFRSIKDFNAFRNASLERISNLPCVSHLLIENCSNLKTMEKLNALQMMILSDSEIDVLPEYLVSVTPCKLRIDCSEELLRKIASQEESGSERQKFKHVPKVTIYSWDDSLYATYQKTPFSFTTNIQLQEQEQVVGESSASVSTKKKLAATTTKNLGSPTYNTHSSKYRTTRSMPNLKINRML